MTTFKCKLLKQYCSSGSGCCSNLLFEAPLVMKHTRGRAQLLLRGVLQSHSRKKSQWEISKCDYFQVQISNSAVQSCVMVAVATTCMKCPPANGIGLCSAASCLGNSQVKDTQQSLHTPTYVVQSHTCANTRMAQCCSCSLVAWLLMYCRWVHRTPVNFGGCLHLF